MSPLRASSGSVNPETVTTASNKPEPLITTTSPRCAEAGANESIVGPLGVVLFTIVKVAEFEVPPAVVTSTEASPADSPSGTVNVTELAVLAVTVADVPPTVTVGGVTSSCKSVPVMVTLSPAEAEVTSKAEITGAGFDEVDALGDGLAITGSLANAPVPVVSPETNQIFVVPEESAAR